jgi:hypothetical protein
VATRRGEAEDRVALADARSGTSSARSKPFGFGSVDTLFIWSSPGA